MIRRRLNTERRSDVKNRIMPKAYEEICLSKTTINAAPIQKCADVKMQNANHIRTFRHDCSAENRSEAEDIRIIRGLIRLAFQANGREDQCEENSQNGTQSDD